jgi:uncharacterized protein
MNPAIPSGRRGGFPAVRTLIILALIALLLGARSIASLVIEIEWWKEVGQLSTWKSMILYSFAPVVLAALAAFVVLWISHARGLKYGGTSLREHPMYARVSALVLLLISFVIARTSLDPWTIVSFFGAARSGSSSLWTDPIFGRPLAFYFFELPLYSQLIGYLVGVAFFAALAYWLPARVLDVIRRGLEMRGGPVEFTLDDLNLGEAFRSPVLRGLIAVFLFGFAARLSLQRYNYLDDDHGFMVGVDYVASHITIPLTWAGVAALCLAAVFTLLGRWKLMLLPVLLMILRVVLPPLVSLAYVKPNELRLQTPYIKNHIAATRAAWGFEGNLKEIQHPGKFEAPIHPERNQALLENVRLWDWRAFHSTITQIQALRQYYVFGETDVDRYTIDGKVRQVMLSSRELDIRQLPDARANWINGHFIYTHGYGLVMAEANRITPQGLPVLLIRDAPPVLETKSLKLTRPEIYYGETVHEPVFVRTQQPEFNYPAGSENVQTRYEGKGGIPISGMGMRLAAALAYTDRNMLLTGVLNPDSRMMIHRDVSERLRKLAGFIGWDPDPYLVVTDEGRLVWMVDGYTSSWRHPYSRRVRVGDVGVVNYVRNSVKAVVDAYDGTIKLYVFDPSDPIIRAFQSIFPTLFKAASEMPPGERAHTRYPELLFRAQAEIYRTFHMQDPEAFYNREDLWDFAKSASSQNNQAQSVEPLYIVGSIPGSSKPEFLLLQPFTPRSKDNLIGVMVARCDGENLGQMLVLQLSKQSLIYGPLQIEARIDSDQIIAKDLSLWNQQGSQVLRGHMLVLPIEDTFLYVEPIYIQSAQAKMPQLKKVVLAMGNTLIYRDTYEQALADLGVGITAPPSGQPAISAAPPPPEEQQRAQAQSVPAGDSRVQTIRDHLRRYRELSAQGKWSDAGRELEALEKLLAR